MAHEFSHSIKIMALEFMDATFKGTVNSAYQNAVNNNLWQNTAWPLHPPVLRKELA